MCAAILLSACDVVWFLLWQWNAISLYLLQVADEAKRLQNTLLFQMNITSNAMCSCFLETSYQWWNLRLFGALVKTSPRVWRWLRVESLLFGTTVWWWIELLKKKRKFCITYSLCVALHQSGVQVLMSRVCRRLEHSSCEEGLRGLGLFSLEKTKKRTYQCL